MSDPQKLHPALMTETRLRMGEIWRDCNDIRAVIDYAESQIGDATERAEKAERDEARAYESRNHWNVQAGHAMHERDWLKREVAARDEQIAALRGALDQAYEWADHDRHCNYHLSGLPPKDVKCDCGYEAVRVAIEAALAQPPQPDERRDRELRAVVEAALSWWRGVRARKLAQMRGHYVVVQRLTGDQLDNIDRLMTAIGELDAAQERAGDGGGV